MLAPGLTRFCAHCAGTPGPSHIEPTQLPESPDKVETALNSRKRSRTDDSRTDDAIANHRDGKRKKRLRSVGTKSIPTTASLEARLKDIEAQNLRLREERSYRTTLIPSGTTPDEDYARKISCLNQNLSELAYELACLRGTTAVQQRSAIKHVLVNALCGVILKPFCPGLPKEADSTLNGIKNGLSKDREYE